MVTGQADHRWPEPMPAVRKLPKHAESYILQAPRRLRNWRYQSFQNEGKAGDERGFVKLEPQILAPIL